MSHTVFLDESGDLGFKFDAPYKKGGSSRHLTMAFMVVPNDKKHLVKRLVKKIYLEFGFAPADEIKGSQLTIEQKKRVAELLVRFIQENVGTSICSMTVKKENVQDHIRKDANLLYNYMMKLSLLDKILTFSHVHLIRDNKSVKVSSGKSLIEYLQTTVYFEHNSKTELLDCPSDSKTVKGLMLIDWLNNIVFGHYEIGNTEPFLVLSPVLKCQTLFH